MSTVQNILNLRSKYNNKIFLEIQTNNGYKNLRFCKALYESGLDTKEQQARVRASIDIMAKAIEMVEKDGTEGFQFRTFFGTKGNLTPQLHITIPSEATAGAETRQDTDAAITTVTTALVEGGWDGETGLPQNFSRLNPAMQLAFLRKVLGSLTTSNVNSSTGDADTAEQEV